MTTVFFNSYKFDTTQSQSGGGGGGGGGSPVSTPVNLLAAADGKSGRAHGTGSYTTAASSAPTNGSLLICVIAFTSNGSAADTITISDSQSHTWTASVAQASRVGSGSDTQAIAIFHAQNSSTSTMTITADAGTCNVYSYNVHLLEVTGHNAASPIGATASSNNTGNGAVALTLSGSPNSNSMVIAAISTYETNDSTNQITPASGWTELIEAARSVPNSQVQYRGSSTSTSVDWDDNGTSVSGWLAQAIEVKPS